MTDWNRIKAFYRQNMAEIMAAPSYQWGIDPYAWEFEAGIRLTPIEFGLWQDLRYVGAVAYPQFPVGRYFVDFGNPAAKVAIECDGAAYHLDKAKDAARQREIERMGWFVYRITGRDCLTDFTESEDDYGRPVCKAGAALKFVREIAAKHWLSSSYVPGEKFTCATTA